MFVPLTCEADIGRDECCEEDGQAEGDRTAHHVQLSSEDAPPAHRALPAYTFLNI
jgi:hypothetical protein